MVESVRAVKGMHDVRPGASEAFLEAAVWERIFAKAAEVLGAYGYRRVWLPVVEETALFARGIGEGTDIVSKEMYSFTDRGDRKLTLRPEGTAGAVRAYVEHNLGNLAPLQRWWYAGSMYRAENVQRGRYREFYQIGAELFGAATPAADAEMLAMVWTWCRALELQGLAVRINTLGDADSRAAYRGRLHAYLETRATELCESCRGRIDRNPLRVLDCKREGCRAVVAGAPDMAASLSDPARAHFEAVQELLRARAVPFTVDSRLVRGLDYYTGLLFEITTTALGAQDAVLGGGRYDDLVAELGGPATPAIGFAAGVERIALLLAAEAAKLARGPHLYIVPMPGAEARALSLADDVRRAGLRVEVDVAGGKLKQQMKRADRSGAMAAVVLGDSELASNRGRLKDLVSASESEVELSGSALGAVLSELARERGVPG